MFLQTVQDIRCTCSLAFHLGSDSGDGPPTAGPGGKEGEGRGKVGWGYNWSGDVN